MTDLGESKGRSAQSPAQKISSTSSPFWKMPAISDEALVIGGSLVFFSLGMALGMRVMMKREKFMFGIRSEHVGLATKALMYGTVLSVGTFGVSTVLFMQATGIRTPKEFGDILRGKLAEVESIQPAPDLAKDIDEKNKMTTEEEMAYWNNLLFRPRSADEKAADDAERHSVQSRQQSKDNADSLSLWDRHFNRPPEAGAEKRQSLWQKWTSKGEVGETDSGTASASSKSSNTTEALTQVQFHAAEGDLQREHPVLLEEQERESLWEKHVRKPQKK